MGGKETKKSWCGHIAQLSGGFFNLRGNCARELGRGRWTSDLAGEKSGKEEPWEARVLELQEDGAKRV